MVSGYNMQTSMSGLISHESKRVKHFLQPLTFLIFPLAMRRSAYPTVKSCNRLQRASFQYSEGVATVPWSFARQPERAGLPGSAIRKEAGFGKQELQALAFVP